MDSQALDVTGAIVATRDSASLPRVIGRWSLTAGIVNGVVGSGIFGLPSTVAALVGAWSPLMVLVAGGFIFLVLLCFAEVGSRFDDAGGPYLYARDAFGPSVGFHVGWLLLSSRLLGCAAALQVLVVYLALGFPAVASPIGRASTMTLAVVIVTAINVTGVRVAAWTGNLMTAAKLLPLLFLVGLGLPYLSRDVFMTQTVVRPAWQDAILLMVFAYGGFESMVIAASETKRPREDTPVALFTAGAAVTVLYSLLQLVVSGVLPHAANSSTPIASALRQLVGSKGETIAGAAVVLSVFGWLTGFTLMMPRVLYSMARHGELPASLGRVHPRFRTPHVAILVNAILALAIALPSSFAQAAAFGAIARLVVFAVTCAALIGLRRSKLKPPSFRLPAGDVIAVAGLIFSLWLLSTRSIRQLGILFGIMAAGFIVRAWQRQAT